MNKYDFIIETLKKAGEILLVERQKDYKQENKHGDVRDILTEVDIILNNFLIGEINKNFPGELIHSEELEAKLKLTDSFWCIDPIDGTSNFANDIPHFAICISFFSEGKIICGAAFNPVTDESFSVNESGAYLNNKKVSVSDITEIKKSTIAINSGRSDELRLWSAELYKQILLHAKSVKNLGSSALDFCFVGAGRVEACLYAQVTVFDIIFAIEFVRKAGGIVTDGNFQELQYSFEKQKVFAFANKEILEAVRAMEI